MNPKRVIAAPPPVRTAVIPRLREVQIYFSEKEFPASVATVFFRHYARIGWLNKAGKPVNWKQEAFRWQLKLYQEKPWLYSRHTR